MRRVVQIKTRHLAVLAAGIVALSSAGVAIAPGELRAQQSISGGRGMIYVAGYDAAIHIVDEDTMSHAGKIQGTAGILRSFQLTHNRQRFYGVTVDFETIEIFDIATRRSITTHSLSHDNSKVRVWGVAIHPDERYLILLTSTDTKLVDRFEIGEPILQQYDLTTRRIVRDIPWPDGAARERAQMMFSPDGKLLYFFAGNVLIYETENFEQVDEWDLSRPPETGLGRMNFGFNQNLYEDPGFFTSIFRTTDPVNGRRMMGIARINLPEKTVDFQTVGPSMGLRGFAVSPDLTKAYSLYSQIGHYEFWTFDLENHRVTNRKPFPGRPRMGLTASSNGDLLYVHTAGNTIDLYDEATYEYLRTVTLDVDMTDILVLPPADARLP